MHISTLYIPGETSCLAPALPKPPLKFFGDEGRAPQKPPKTKNSITRE